MRFLTNKEIELWATAIKVLGSPITPRTNETALDYILSGRTAELEELIREANPA